ncbi:MAG: ABC transporter permease subunit [Lachnospiraceae bacterium]|nr:ABC transporter permease subunit [Lachnospiraceae bacterium]
MRKRKNIHVKSLMEVVLTYSALILVSGIFFFPVLWLILASFSKSGSIYDFKGFFPSSYSARTYRQLFTDIEMYNYPVWLKNTLFVSAFSCVLGTILVILTAYTMSRFRFWMRKPLMKATLVLSMFPGFMTMTAVYLIMVNFGLINNLWSLVLIYAAGAPMSYLVQKGYFDTINHSIYEAARIDGATNPVIFIKMTLPLSKPILVYTALTSFAWPWSDFILPNLLLKNRDLWTVAVGLTHMGETEFARFAAGAIFIAVPIVILYFALSKFLVAGVSDGAVKG